MLTVPQGGCNSAPYFHTTVAEPCISLRPSGLPLSADTPFTPSGYHGIRASIGNMKFIDIFTLVLYDKKLSQSRKYSIGNI